MEGFTSIDEILRVIDVNDDFGEKDKDLKDAIIGKTSTTTTSTPNPFTKQNIETL